MVKENKYVATKLYRNVAAPLLREFRIRNGGDWLALLVNDCLNTVRELSTVFEEKCFLERRYPQPQTFSCQ